MQVSDIYGDLPELTSERLSLRKITMADLEDHFQLLSDDEGSRFLPFGPHTSRSQTEAGIRHIQTLYETGQLSPWGIVEKETGRTIGTTGYATWLPSHGTAELHYQLAHDRWGRGLAVEAARSVIRFGFERMALNRIQAHVSPENHASRRVAAKLGMQEEGLARESFNIHGVFRDHLLYAVLRRDWAENASGPRY